MKWYIKDGVLSKSKSDAAAVFEVAGYPTEIVIPLRKYTAEQEHIWK